jgi:hypothetical protein
MHVTNRTRPTPLTYSLSDASRVVRMASNLDESEEPMSWLAAITLAWSVLQTPATAGGAVLSGVVLEDGSQKPLPGAQITLMKIDAAPSAPFGASTRHAVSDREGRYQFDGLENGRYHVTVEKNGYVRLDAPDTPAVVLTGGKRQTVQFTLTKGAIVVGHVLDDAGEPVVQAQVMVLRKPPVPTPNAFSGVTPALFPSNMAPTNDLGEFRIFGLAPHSEYYVQAIVPNWRFDESTAARATVLMPTFFPSAADWQGAQPIAMAAGQTSADLVIRMIARPAFHVSGVVVDESGRPVVNALIRLERDREEVSALAAGQMPFHTDGEGRFTINNVTSGSYTLVAIAPVVTSRAPRSGHVTGGSNSGGFATFGGIVAGTGGSSITTETRDGVTTEYRDDAATRVPVAVNDANVQAVEITVRRPAR